MVGKREVKPLNPNGSRIMDCCISPKIKVYIDHITGEDDGTYTLETKQQCEVCGTARAMEYGNINLIGSVQDDLPAGSCIESVTITLNLSKSFIRTEENEE